MKRTTTLLARLTAALTLALTTAVGAAADDLADSVNLDIAAQPLEAALLEFSKQTGLQLVVPTGSLPAHTTRPVTGNMPLQAALTSAASFAAGSALPVVAAVLSPTNLRVGVIAGSALVFLAILGAISARTGGAPVATAALRVTVWGAVAMGFTALVGSLFHLAVE